MTVTIQTFLTQFNGDTLLTSLNPNLIINTIAQIGIETCNYSGLQDEATADQALSLHAAHFLTMTAQTSQSYAYGSKIKRLKSKNDEIEYGGNQLDPFDLTTTGYGKRLQKMLEVHYVPFCL